MRLDLYLFQNGITTSRSRAQALINAGSVYVNGKNVTRNSLDVCAEDNIELRGEDLLYVSRGGLKLEAALDSFGIDPTGMTAIDIGASTGGFTDCLLQRGASFVAAVDSGHGQLNASLLSDKRVLSLEGVNARTLTAEITSCTADIIVMDVSFISQTLIHPVIPNLLNKGGVFISLIKPQFEVGRDKIGKNGIVKNPEARFSAVASVIESASVCGLMCRSLIRSPITGGDGNVEYLALFEKNTIPISRENILKVIYDK